MKRVPIQLAALFLISLLCGYLLGWMPKRDLITLPLFPADGTWRSLTQLASHMLGNLVQAGTVSELLRLDMGAPDALYGNTSAYHYYSYPQGFLLPVAILFKTFEWAATTINLMRISLAAAILCGWLLSVVGWGLSYCREGIWPFFCGLLTLILFFLAPVTYAWLPGIWWPDSAGLVPSIFALVWFLFRERVEKGQKWIDLVVIGLCFWIDWYSLIVGIMFFFLVGRKSRFHWIGALLLGLIVFSIYLFPVIADGAWRTWLAKIFERTRISGGGSPPVDWTMLFQNYSPYLGYYGPPLVGGVCWLGASRSWVWFRDRKLAIGDGFLLLLSAPLLIHFFILNEHYVEHFYNSIRWVIPMAVLPVFFMSQVRREWLRAVGLVALLFPAILYFPHIRKVYAASVVSVPYKYVEFCGLLRKEYSPTTLFFVRGGGQEERENVWYLGENHCSRNIFLLDDGATIFTGILKTRHRGPYVLMMKEKVLLEHEDRFVAPRAGSDLGLGWKFHEIKGL